MNANKFDSESIKLQIKNDLKILQEPLGFIFIALIIIFIASFWEPAIYVLVVILVPIIFGLRKVETVLP